MYSIQLNGLRTTAPRLLYFTVLFLFQEKPGQVEEYVDEKGRRVKRILRKTYVTKTITIKGQQMVEQEPVEDYPEVSAEALEPTLAGKYH